MPTKNKQTIAVDHAEIIQVLDNILIKYGFSEDKAQLCATLFANASLDGVESHGINRFLPFLETVEKGIVDKEATAKQVGSFGALEQWDGQSGVGPVNAQLAMKRAIELSCSYGVGCVAMRNTNHWMRAGSYGLLAAEAGRIGMCFTNTKPNMAAWRGKRPSLGNNPLVIAIPGKEHPILLDMAMSVYSFGKMETLVADQSDQELTVGLDNKGNLTKDPKKVLDSGMAMPIGFWKGAGLSFVLDLVAGLLANGNTTSKIEDDETNISQVFMAIHLDRCATEQMQEDIISHSINFFKDQAVDAEGDVRYPGERMFATRKRQLVEGVSVDKSIWQKIVKLA